MKPTLKPWFMLEEVNKRMKCKSTQIVPHKMKLDFVIADTLLKGNWPILFCVRFRFNDFIYGYHFDDRVGKESLQFPCLKLCWQCVLMYRKIFPRYKRVQNAFYSLWFDNNETEITLFRCNEEGFYQFLPYHRVALSIGACWNVRISCIQRIKLSVSIRKIKTQIKTAKWIKCNFAACFVYL